MFVNLNHAVKILQNSGIVAFPTETVYGLGAVATDLVAIKKVYKAKNRPTDNPLICHFYNFLQVKKYITLFPDYLEFLVSKLSPGPVSYLVNLPSNSSLKPAVGGLESLIFRIPDHPIALELLQKVDIPIAAPSANTSTKFSPTSAFMVEMDLGEKIDGILEGKNSIVGLESSILDCREKDKISILRPGIIGKNELEEILRDSKFATQIKIIDFGENSKKISKTDSKAFITPGQKYRHYAPRTKIIQINTQLLKQTLQKKDFSSQRIGVLSDSLTIFKMQELSKQKNLFYLDLGLKIKQIAQNFYHNLFLLDQQNLDFAYIVTENLDNSSLSLALKNRIQKIISF